MSWSFAIINNRLAEVFFDKKKGKILFWAHCYVKASEYKTKQEKNWIKNDTAKIRLIYRNQKYLKAKTNIPNANNFKIGQKTKMELRRDLKVGKSYKTVKELFDSLDARK
ncbi:MAG: hypothetical protein AAB453_03975 [Patescibacteria group bacterium]